MQQELKIRDQQHNKCVDSNPLFCSPNSKYHGGLGYDSTDNDLHNNTDSSQKSKFLPPWKPRISVSVVYISMKFFMATTRMHTMNMSNVCNNSIQYYVPLSQAAYLS